MIPTLGSLSACPTVGRRVTVKTLVAPCELTKMYRISMRPQFRETDSFKGGAEVVAVLVVVPVPVVPAAPVEPDVAPEPVVPTVLVVFAPG